ncbi:MAG TPA: hypothetical protein VJ739_14125 [Gemmataceae bacterium]|nr:hypothetical protein [Gemmataceae bacterium]
MRRLFVAALALVFLPPGLRAADAFDHYTNPILRKVPSAAGVREVKQLTPTVITDNLGVLPGSQGAFLVVMTNDGRRGKLLIQAARQKIGPDKTPVPILLIERFVTYKEGTEETVQASGQNVALYPGFRFSLDLGQVVPAEVPADLRFTAEGGKAVTEAVGKAKLYLMTKPLPEAAPKRTAKVVIGATFESRYFNGTYRLHDDGRRSGKLVLKVEDGGEVTGSFTSDKDGDRYEVKGKVGMPANAIQFTIKFPRVEETFQGWMFTGDGAAIAGSSRLLERESGFYAVRVEEQ